MGLVKSAFRLDRPGRLSYDGAREGAVRVKKKWKILLMCVVALAAIAAWCFVPRVVAEGEYRVYYVASGQGLTNVTDQVDLDALGSLLRGVERRGYRIGVFPVQTRDSSVEIGVLGDGWHCYLYMDEDTCVVYDDAGKGCCPIIDGGALRDQVWALLPEP